MLLISVTDINGREVLIRAESILKMTNTGHGTTSIVLAPGVRVDTETTLAELAERIGPHEPHRPF